MYRTGGMDKFSCRPERGDKGRQRHNHAFTTKDESWSLLTVWADDHLCLLEQLDDVIDVSARLVDYNLVMA